MNKEPDFAAPLPLCKSHVSFHFHNLRGTDIQWLTDVCELFCDPERREELEFLRNGNLELRRHPTTGRLLTGGGFHKN